MIKPKIHSSVGKINEIKDFNFAAAYDEEKVVCVSNGCFFFFLVFFLYGNRTGFCFLMIILVVPLSISKIIVLELVESVQAED